MHFKDHCNVHVAWVEWDNSNNNNPVGSVVYEGIEERRPFRAARLVDDSERFLFLYFPRKSRERAIEKFLLDKIDKGLEVEDRTYRFFGIAESGIKEGWVVFFHEDRKWTVDRVLDECGDLKNVFVNDGPGKYMARLGLSFSATHATIDAPDGSILKLEDSKAKDGTLTTDGCGMIRESYAKQVRECLDGVDWQTMVFQFRCRGQKGVLVAYPDRLFDKLCGVRSGKGIYAFRPSMHKYDGGPTVIEVNNVSMPPLPAKLNFFFVIILLTLGVEVTAIEDLLNAQILEIEAIAHDRKKALSCHRGELDAEGDGFYQDMFEMLQAGHEMDEPHLRTILQRYQQCQYTALRKRLNITVPKSCYLFGVVDEQGLLKDKEVYINLPSLAGVLEGKVLVARNPSYFPSDLRVLEAVNIPGLAFLRDCIVFPRDGRTSLPNMMAGGDLDGDRYFVCFDPTLIPSRKAVQKPEKPTIQLSDISRSATQIPRRPSDLKKAVAKSFARMHSNSLLGSASNEWQRVVEITSQLANSEYPKKLAEIVAVALDMLKTGADCQELEDIFEDLKDTYSKLEEKNFRSPVDALRALVPNSDGHRPIEGKRTYNIDPALNIRKFDPALWDRYYEEGRQKIDSFNRRLGRAIGEKRINDERRGKAVRRYGNRKRENENNAADKLKKAYTQKYFRPSENALDHSRCFRASAWYVIGYERGKPTFAWLGARYLNHLKASATNGGMPGVSIGALRDKGTAVAAPQSVKAEERKKARPGAWRTSVSEHEHSSDDEPADRPPQKKPGKKTTKKRTSELESESESESEESSSESVDSDSEISDSTLVPARKKRHSEAPKKKRLPSSESDSDSSNSSVYDMSLKNARLMSVEKAEQKRHGFSLWPW